MTIPSEAGEVLMFTRFWFKTFVIAYAITTIRRKYTNRLSNTRHPRPM